jgi:hypothetical protein
LLPGEERSARVELRGARTGSATGTLTVESDDPRGQRQATFEGEVVNAEVVEVLELAPTQLDLLFAVDLSCSMVERVEDLPVQAVEMTRQLEEAGWDWQLGVVVRATGCFSAPILTAESADPTAALQAALDTPIGIVDKGLTESLLRLSDQAFSQAYPGLCNEGFLRPEAKVHVVVLSDEPEQSGDPLGYLAAMQDRVGEDRLVVSGAINLGGCEYGGASGYAEAIRETGGTAFDICRPSWAAALPDLHAAVTPDSDAWLLGQVPVPGTLEVTVDGKPSDAWTLDEGGLSLVFDPPLPRGSVVEARYQGAADCEE